MDILEEKRGLRYDRSIKIRREVKRNVSIKEVTERRYG
jgi:hypothetical protein